MSKLERDIIAERVKGGLRKAKANGKRLGRPEAEIDAKKVVEYKEQGKSIREIAKKMGLSRSKDIETWPVEVIYSRIRTNLLITRLPKKCATTSNKRFQT